MTAIVPERKFQIGDRVTLVYGDIRDNHSHGSASRGELGTVVDAGFSLFKNAEAWVRVKFDNGWEDTSQRYEWCYELHERPGATVLDNAANDYEETLKAIDIWEKISNG